MSNKSVYCGITKELAEATKRLQVNDQNLEEIELDFNLWNGFFAYGVMEEFVAVMETCGITNLQKIGLHSQNHESKNRKRREHIARIVRCDCIHDLTLCSIFSFDDFAPIFESLSKNSATKKLRIINSRWGKEGAAAIAKSLHSEKSSLKSFDLDSTEIGDDDCATIVGALSNYPSLEILNMIDCDIRVKGAIAIGKFLRSSGCAVEKFRIGGNCGICDEGCSSIMNGLLENSSIRLLNMENCGIGQEGAKAIANTLSSGKCVIEDLNLRRNDGIGDEGSAVIMEALRKNKSVCKIDLSFCCIRNEGMKAIAKVLQNNHATCLRTLSLQRNCLEMEGFKALSTALAQNSSLYELDLSCCQDADDEGLIALMNSLSQNSSLRSIKLQDCYIGNGDFLESDTNSDEGDEDFANFLESSASSLPDEIGKAVVNFLKSNTSSLCSLYLDGNFFNEESLIEIAKALPFNTHLTSLSLGYAGQELTRKVWLAFNDAVRHNFFLEELDLQTLGDKFYRYKMSINESIGVNDLGPVKAEIVKTGLFPCRILPCLTTTSCSVEALSKVTSLKRLSPVFDLVRQRPALFDLDNFIAGRPKKKVRTQ